MELQSEHIRVWAQTCTLSRRLVAKISARSELGRRSFEGALSVGLENLDPVSPQPASIQFLSKVGFFFCIFFFLSCPSSTSVVVDSSGCLFFFVFFFSCLFLEIVFYGCWAVMDCLQPLLVIFPDPQSSTCFHGPPLDVLPSQPTSLVLNLVMGCSKVVFFFTLLTRALAC